MKVDILSLFPNYFQSPFEASILRRAQEKKLLTLRCIDIRSFAQGKHNRVDDRPYGGGPGMVLMPGPLCDAIRSIKQEKSHVIYLSPQGKKLTTSICKRLAKKEHLIFVCGHYEGIDERVLTQEVDEELSIGDYILTNGCIAAIVVIDATARFIPGVLGNPDGAEDDSFQEGLFEGPQFTRPVDYEGLVVPLVLRQGNHKKIQEWKSQQAKEKTRRVRPDLLKIKENNNEIY